MASVPPSAGEAGPQAIPGAVTFQSRDVVVAGLLAACAPLVLMVFNRDWLFTPETYLDPWHYVGFFREYLNPNYSPGAYKLARLPWILAGFLTHTLLPPLQAAYVLHGLFLCVTSLALFVGLYALLRRVALAAVVAIALGFYTHAHGSGGWDYHNTGAGAFYLVTFMLLALPAAIAGRRVPLMLAGAAAALAVHTNITLANFLPALAFVHVRTVQLRTGELPRVRALAARAGWGLLGAVLVTMLLGAINWMAGREFLFFAALVNIVSQYVADPQRYQSGYHSAWSSGWALTAGYLALLAAVFVAGAVSSAIRRSTTDTTDRLATLLVAQFLVMSLVWVGWQTAGQTALDWNFFAYVLIPSCFIALGGVLYGAWPESCERHWLATVLGTVIACAICLSGALDPYMQDIDALVAPVIAVVGFFLFVAGFLVYLSRPGVATSIVLLVSFAAGNRLVAGSRQAYDMSDPCKIQPAVYESIIDGASWLEKVDPTYTRLRTWFDQNEQIHPIPGCAVGVGQMAGAMTAMAFVPYITTPWPMPGVEAVPGAAVQGVANSEAVLAIISSRPEHVEAWSRRLEAMGLTYRELARHFVPLLASGFTIYAWELAQKPPREVTFGVPIIAVTDKTHQEINVYGTPKGEVTTEGDRVVFTPTDARDHVAYPFVKLSTLTSESWARLTVESPATNPPSCRLIVQAPDFTTLASVPCAPMTRYVKLPPNTQGVRVYLTDAQRRPFVLPRNIEVALSESAR